MNKKPANLNKTFEISKIKLKSFFNFIHYIPIIKTVINQKCLPSHLSQLAKSWNVSFAKNLFRKKIWKHESVDIHHVADAIMNGANALPLS
jgi:hypothetical protein